MNIRVLDKNDKAALEQLIYTIENALPVPEWWIPIDDIERSHFFDADWTCFLGAFNDDNELVAASALFFNEHEFAEEAEKLGLDIRSTNVAEVGRCMVHPDFRGHNLMCELNKRLCSIARNRGIDGPAGMGTYLWVEVDNLKRLEAKIVEGPYIHHCVAIHANVVPVLYEACKYIGIVPDLYDPIEEDVKAYLRGE